MARQEIHEFLWREYRDLWESWGVENPLEKQPLPPKAKRRPAPVSLETPTSLEGVRELLGQGCGCSLCPSRNKLVFGEGSPKAKLMFVGEAPGADEDAQGIPFVGRAGQLLTKIIEAMGLTRDEVYIANVVKCRPPQNRVPFPEEIETCLPYLKMQISVVKPEFIVTLGATATQNLIGSTQPMSNLRSRFHALAWDEKTQVMPTYHPAYLLRNPSAKKLVWDDMKLVMERLRKPH